MNRLLLEAEDQNAPQPNSRMDPTALRAAAHPNVSLADALPDAQRARGQPQFAANTSRLCKDERE